MRLGKTKFNNDKLNICQVSLRGNIPIIIQNLQKMKSFYKDLNVFIICPKKDYKLFRKKLNFKQVILINEDQIISFGSFRKIFLKLSKNYK